MVASGFTLIFGLMRVVNMAHGSLYLLGGYIALEIQTRWFQEDAGSGCRSSGASDAEYGLMGWLVPLVVATLADRRSSASRCSRSSCAGTRARTCARR